MSNTVEIIGRLVEIGKASDWRIAAGAAGLAVALGVGKWWWNKKKAM